MVEEFYRMALERFSRHLSEAGTDFSLEDGDIRLSNHRIGLSIAFDGFSRQQDQVIAPLDIQLHLDGDNGDRFRVGTLGVGADQNSATEAAVEEWYVLAAQPLLESLGVFNRGRRKPTAPHRIGRWELFAGQVGVRGCPPSDSADLARLYLDLLGCIQKTVVHWQPPHHFQLRTIYLMATCADGSCEVQAAQDGLLSAELSDAIAALDWPASPEVYLVKQLFVLRGRGE